MHWAKYTNTRTGPLETHKNSCFLANENPLGTLVSLDLLKVACSAAKITLKNNGTNINSKSAPDFNYNKDFH